MENKQRNQAPAQPCNFDDLENYNMRFSQNDSMNEIYEKINNLDIKEGNEKIMKPRDYQQKIFDKAKNQNSIIYVETGKGKTFISIMLMANHLGIDINCPSKSNKNK